MWDHYYNTVQQQTKNLFETSRKIHWNKVYHFYSLPIFQFVAKTSCIWKFIQRHSPYLEFRWQYCRILFGYQARIFHFFNVSHKCLRFTTWNLIAYLYTRDFQRATGYLNVQTNILFCFVYGCEHHTKISERNQRGGNLLSRFALLLTLNPFY